jgi:hypothetical protein
MLMEGPQQTQQNEKTHQEKRQLVREWRWWRLDPLKLTKLEQAFAIGCTDKEACGYAGITERQLYYYEKLNPEFVSRKAVLKDTLVLQARMTIAGTIKESYHNAMDFLKKKRKHEFGDNLNLDEDNKPVPQSNAIVFVNFSNKPDATS